jgi:hypothetical protein
LLLSTIIAINISMNVYINDIIRIARSFLASITVHWIFFSNSLPFNLCQAPPLMDSMQTIESDGKHNVPLSFSCFDQLVRSAAALDLPLYTTAIIYAQYHTSIHKCTVQHGGRLSQPAAARI